MNHRQQPTKRREHTLDALHTSLMSFNALFNLSDPPRLTNPHQLLHLTLQ